MKVLLAGFNVDTEVLKPDKKSTSLFTPESISAAYARISRSPKSVDGLRSEAREAVAKARQSNRMIIFDMGHHSVAEHAVFNFDVIGISRRAVEELEKFRLCSFTEKSQRYVTLKGDYVVPKELRGTRLHDEYVRIIQAQNNMYKILHAKINEYLIRKFPHLTTSKKNLRLLENLSKEDARYILSLATQTQLGATINARNLELMLRRFASHQLEEMRELGKNLYRLVKTVAPSIILFYRKNDYDEKTYPTLQNYAHTLFKTSSSAADTHDVRLVNYTRDADDTILTSILFRVSQRDYAHCLKRVKRMTRKEKRELYKKTCHYVELYDVVLREFEYAHLTYALIVSAACFGQLKRHRIATITAQDYDINLGITIPDSVKEVGEEKRFINTIKKTEKVFQKIEKRFPGIGSYVLTNAHRKRVLINMNLRELYHFSRLREDATAQWDIRDKAYKMSTLAKKVMPITTQLLGSKREYPEIYFKLFGKHPKVTEVPLP
jgi:flavin-dependent thymidylate synthase